MNTEAIHQKLRDTFSDAIMDLAPALPRGYRDPFIEVKADKIHSVLTFLKKDRDLLFENILCISGVDLKDRFEVVYHFHSYQHLHTVVIKATISDYAHPKIDTVCDLWRGANWLEREIFDMFGIHFNNHPDLTRILCPDDWEGYPLRKDYKHQENYHGVKVGM